MQREFNTPVFTTHYLGGPWMGMSLEESGACHLIWKLLTHLQYSQQLT